MNYALCPDVTLTEIVRQTRSAIFWLKRYGRKYGVNPTSLTISGHSAGGWDSLLLKSNFPSEVDGVIAFNPARSGKFAKNKKPHRGWVNWRKYKVSLIKVDKLEKVLVYSHEKDAYENTKTLSFLSNSNTVEFIDLTNTKCKKKTILGGWHGITLTKCFADQDPISKKIIKYLEEVY